MDPKNFSDDSSYDENLQYLLATGILPFISLEGRPGPSGSMPGKAANLSRDFRDALHRVNNDYFGSSPKYNQRQFERRFRVPPSVFDKIERKVTCLGIFTQRSDALNKKGIHPRLRITDALRMLAYVIPTDLLDEYLQMSEDSILLSTKQFCEEVVELFEDEYLRAPRADDLQRIMKINAARGFPGCVGSIDCMHWEWKNCPVAWAGQFAGKEKKPTVVLEAISDRELWKWHNFFVAAGSMNDINVMDRSPTMEGILSGKFPPDVCFRANGVEYRMPYYLADGIYFNWALFAKTISEGSTPKEKLYGNAQEAVRKDVERAFGVLVSRFAILARPCRFWYNKDMSNVMKACVILHNMVVEARRGDYESGMYSLGLSEEARRLFQDNGSFEWKSREAIETRAGTPMTDRRWAAMVVEREDRISSVYDHFKLKHDLIEHIWKKQGM